MVLDLTIIIHVNTRGLWYLNDHLFSQGILMYSKTFSRSIHFFFNSVERLDTSTSVLKIC